MNCVICQKYIKEGTGYYLYNGDAYCYKCWECSGINHVSPDECDSRPDNFFSKTQKDESEAGK